MKNQSKQMADLKRQLAIEKNKNIQLQSDIETLKKSIKLNKENKRIQETIDWKKLLGRKSYDDEKRVVVKTIKSLLNIPPCIIKFFSIRPKDVKGTHISFTLKKTISSTFFNILAIFVVALAIHIISPSLLSNINEFIKQFPMLMSFLQVLFKVLIFVFLIFMAKVLQIIGFEVDNSNDDEFVDSMFDITNQSIKRK